MEYALKKINNDYLNKIKFKKMFFVKFPNKLK